MADAPKGPHTVQVWLLVRTCTKYENPETVALITLMLQYHNFLRLVQWAVYSRPRATIIIAIDSEAVRARSKRIAVARGISLSVHIYMHVPGMYAYLQYNFSRSPRHLCATSLTIAA